MATSVSTATYGSQVTANVAIDTADVPAAASAQTRTLTMSGFDTVKALDPTTSPPVSKAAYFVAALSGGAAVLDLTALPGGVTGNVDLTSKRVVLFKLANPGTNPVAVAADGTNGYLLLGASGSAVVPAGGELTVYLANGGPVVGGSAKRIALTGTGTDSFNVAVLGG